VKYCEATQPCDQQNDEQNRPNAHLVSSYNSSTRCRRRLGTLPARGTSFKVKTDTVFCH
jgi:hypothetical protein